MLSEEKILSKNEEKVAIKRYKGESGMRKQGKENKKKRKESH